MKAYYPYITIVAVCAAVWIIIKFGTGLLPSYSLPQVEILPLPDRILAIETRKKLPSTPIRISAFLGARTNRVRTGYAKGLNGKVLEKKAIQERFTLRAIVVDGERRFASIKGYSIVAEGDSLEEYIVTAIGVDTVKLNGPKGEEMLVFQDVQKGE